MNWLSLRINRLKFRLQKITYRFKGICEIYHNSIKKNKKITTCIQLDIRLFGSIIMFCGTIIIRQNIPIINLNVGIFYMLLSIPQNIVMDLNNVMDLEIDQLRPKISPNKQTEQTKSKFAAHGRFWGPKRDSSEIYILFKPNTPSQTYSTK